MADEGRTETPEPIYFESPGQLRDWFDANHETATELWVGYWKKATGRPTVTWAQAVDEALCVGWIDTTRYSVDDERSRQRFTPRRKGSNWSAVNVANVERLTKEGRMRPAGLRAFEARTEARTAVYSYEQRHEARLTDEEEARFRANEAAWAWFQERPQAYRTGATWWVVNVKRPETRERRLTLLIEESAKGRRPKALTPPGMNPDGTPSR
ncbi:MAG TPA: YdeI/OmpD-associated family protein [Candidatus Limnocylindrales bacterium]|nr:YdeI/OmpD-associated family protein [Candidatus Limnocylindrales bacterium]